MKRCIGCSENFEVTSDDRASIARLSPVVGGRTIDLPEPMHCPSCRQQRRLAFRNDAHYYKNTCVFCKKNVISIYSPDKDVPVLCHDCFWSDQWDPHSYGVDFDFNKTFAEQFEALKKRVPRLCIFNTQSDNSDYTVHSSRNRNCYMCCSTVGCEDVFFSDWAIGCKDSSDLLMCNEMELSYACNDSRHCYGSEYLELCFNVSDSHLCFDCHGSQQLVGCVSLKNKKCMILNESADTQKVESTIEKLKIDRKFRAEFMEKFETLKRSIPKRAAWNLNTEDVQGNYLQNAKNVYYSFNSMDIEDCRYVFDVVRAKNCCDVTRASDCEMLYDCKGVIDLQLSCFCNLTYQCNNLLYCDNGNSSSYCLGCFSIKKSQYCILNKQYTKEEYESLVPKIIEHMRTTGEWGEFFPIKLSSFGYNETKAAESYPLTKEEVLKRGWMWSDYEQSLPQEIVGINANNIPENISDVPDDILNYVISSEGAGKPFRLIPQELAFYRKKGLPIPHQHPHERQLALAALQNPRTLYKRTCGKCKREIETTYAPDRPEVVYCETCYLETVY